jgi:diguanylate cyclase (GGDEF)-like protein
MEAGLPRGRRRIALAALATVIGGLLTLAIVTVAVDAPAPSRAAGPDGLGASLVLGAVACLAVVALAVLMVHRYLSLLVHAATHDHLTGALNRQALDAAGEHALASAQRSGAPLSLILVDVDGLKHVNDTYGHNAGDAALRAVMRAARATTRRTDLVCRWGGDEFVVMLPSCPLQQAKGIAAGMSTGVRSARTGRSGLVAPISISTGVAAWSPGDGLDDLIGRADAAMYASRRTDRARQPPRDR